MQSTANVLALKYREGISLFLRILTLLGLTRKEIAAELGVTPAIVTYWEKTERRITAQNAIKVYGVFVDNLMDYWPEDDVTKQQRLLPLMERLAQVWSEASELRTKQADEELNALLDQCSPAFKKSVRTVEEWYQVESASEKARQLAATVREHDEIAKAWRTAQETIEQAKAKAAGEPLAASDAALPRQPGQRAASRQRREKKVRAKR